MKKLQELSCEVQRKEEWLQEERAEREKIEAELGRERECNRVSEVRNIATPLSPTQTHLGTKNNHSRATDLHHQSLRLHFGNWRMMAEFSLAL